MLAHTFLAITAHTTKKGGTNKPHSLTRKPDQKPHHPSIDA
jgi:hypothetical protein